MSRNCTLRSETDASPSNRLDSAEAGDSERFRSKTACRVASAAVALIIATTTWAHAQSSENGKLTPVFPGPVARLGRAVAIDGDTAVTVANEATFVFVRTSTEPRLDPGSHSRGAYAQSQRRHRRRHGHPQ